MGPVEREDERDGFEPYPYRQSLGGEQAPREPTNVELEASARSSLWPGGPSPKKPNWAALVAVVALIVVLIVATLTAFPLDTWEFQFGP